MKKIILTVMFLTILTAGVFAQDSSEKISADANALLTSLEARSEAYHSFLDGDVFANVENRFKLNEYQRQFTDMNAKIYHLKNKISIGQRSRDPDINTINKQRDELKNYVDEYDKLLSEFKQWVSGLS